MDDVFLQVGGIHAGYGRLEVLHGVNLDVRRGGFVCLLGPNGAGKSTLLRSIFGMCTVSGGSIRLEGHELRGKAPLQVLAAGVVYVPQGRCNFPLMTVQENLEMAAYARRGAPLRDDLDYVFQRFPTLKERRRQLAGNLSGGEQQILEMGMALLRRPKLLLIDEPSLGLSPHSIHDVFSEIQRLHSEGRTIVLVEQNTRKALEVSEEAVVMRLGQVVWQGAARSITQKQLAELFLTGALRFSADT